LASALSPSFSDDDDDNDDDDDGDDAAAVYYESLGPLTERKSIWDGAGEFSHWRNNRTIHKSVKAAANGEGRLIDVDVQGDNVFTFKMHEAHGKTKLLVFVVYRGGVSIGCDPRLRTNDPIIEGPLCSFPKPIGRVESAGSYSAVKVIVHQHSVILLATVGVSACYCGCCFLLLVCSLLGLVLTQTTLLFLFVTPLY
jgi:hypothetical protein